MTRLYIAAILCLVFVGGGRARGQYLSSVNNGASKTGKIEDSVIDIKQALKESIGGAEEGVEENGPENIESDSFIATSTSESEGGQIAGKKLQGREGLSNDEFINLWAKFAIQKNTEDFDGASLFLDAFKSEIPMRDAIIKTATEAIQKTKQPLSEKFLWIYKHNANYRNLFLKKGLNQTNYKSFFEKNKIKTLAELLLFVDKRSNFDRASDMIWKKQYMDSYRSLKGLNSKQFDILAARLYMSQSSKKFDKFKENFKNVIQKKYYLQDEGLLYSYTKYLIKKDDFDEIFDNLIGKILTTSRNDNDWWGVKEVLIVESIKKGDYKTAYNVAMPTDGLDGPNMARAKWVSGFIAMKFLGEYKIAAEFFRSVYDDYTFASTKSRGAYWAGRAYEMLEDVSRADDWYSRASEYPLNFYGQQAILKRLNMQDERMFYKDSNTNNDPNFFSEQMVVFNKIFDEIKTELEKTNRNLNSSVQKKLEQNFLWIGGMYLYKTNYRAEAMEFFQTLIKTQNKYIAMLAVYKLKSVLSYYEYKTITNLVSSLNIPLMDLLYGNDLPNTKYSNKSLIYSVIQRESGFKIDAISTVGALGLMQVMPYTAKQICSEIGEKYSYIRLLNDANYNVELGSYYINKLLELFDNSYPLAIASYNGGPNAVKMWLSRNDFIQTTDQAIDWIELISYKETRNYVAKVMENDIIYRYITRFGTFKTYN